MAKGQRRQPDHYTRRAHAEGRPARSVYKLEEMDRRWGLLRPGDRVLDLGCAPGSWLQYAGEKVGAAGRVLGLDLNRVTIGLPPQVEARQADIFALTIDELRGPFDVVLSDMAPSTMGDHATDALRSAALAERALAIAAAVLVPAGHVVVKVLEGRDLPALVQGMRQSYLKVEQLRPAATRKRSTEIFLLGLGKKV